MKVGDLVQQGARVVKFKGESAPKKSKRVGVVMEIHEIPVEMLNGRSDWAEVFGRTVDVLWDNGIWTHNIDDVEVLSADR